MSKKFLIAMSFLVLTLAIVACGSSDSDTGSAGSSGTGSSESGGEPIKVGLVTTGPVDDKGFNQQSNEGIEEAEEELGIEGRVVISQSSADYIPNLSGFAQQGYDLVIAVGFEMAEAVNTVATKFPETDFTIIDYPATELPDKPQNVEGLLFNEKEGGYLAGYAAGLYAKGVGGKAVSSVGGEKIPPVDNYIEGFQAGAKAANPSVEVLNGYSQDFVDPSKCKEIALDQIAKGSVAVIQLAGGCGLGALDAAQEQGVQGIGESSDQSYLGDDILTSALKKVNVAEKDSIKRAQEGKFLGGTDVIGTVATGALGLGTFDAAGKPYEAAARKVEREMADGKIPSPIE